MMMMMTTMMMDVVISKYIIIPSLVFGCVILMSSIMKLVNKFWWTPMRIQRIMRSQGINGPSYKFIQGNMRDMYTKRMQAMATPMELSHNILPRVIPHVHSWLNDYGMLKQLYYVLIKFFHNEKWFCGNREELLAVVWDGGTVNHYGPRNDQRSVE